MRWQKPEVGGTCAYLKSIQIGAQFSFIHCIDNRAQVRVKDNVKKMQNTGLDRYVHKTLTARLHQHPILMARHQESTAVVLCSHSFNI